jgi:hypothetical protein
MCWTLFASVQINTTKTEICNVALKRCAPPITLLLTICTRVRTHALASNQMLTDGDMGGGKFCRARRLEMAYMRDCSPALNIARAPAMRATTGRSASPADETATRLGFRAVRRARVPSRTGSKVARGKARDGRGWRLPAFGRAWRVCAGPAPPRSIRAIDSAPSRARGRRAAVASSASPGPLT